jgi:uncharacterized protein (TIGR03382 family)
MSIASSLQEVSVRIAVCIAALLACAASNATAQPFQDLDFDSAIVPIGSDGFPVPFLTWAQGAPGWGHSAGDSTDYIGLLPNLGYSQTYALLESPYGAASGPYGLAMRSGNYTEGDPNSQFVQAFIAQTGTLAPNVTSVSLLASNVRFELSLNGTHIDMAPVGLDPDSPTYQEDLLDYSGEWTGDVSGFAGQTVQLEIMDFESPPNPPLFIVDEIRFLPSVPEPPTAALCVSGLLVALLVRRRSNHRRCCCLNASSPASA